ncbi:MAG: sulfite exporter TauE/SafE family protein [Pseudomonadota bacterium]
MIADVTTAAAGIAVFGFLFAGFVKGATGLGFSSTCLPFLVLALGLERAMPLVLVSSIASNAMVHVQAGAVRETVSRFWPMFLGLMPGLALGLWLLAHVNLVIAAGGLGVVLMVYGVWTLGHIDAQLPARLSYGLRVPVGVATGLVNGVTGSQIMPVLPFLLAQPLRREIFLQAINISFTLSSIVVAVGLWKIGFLTGELAFWSVAGTLPAALGVAAGTRVRNQLGSQAFRRAVLLTLIGLGALLVARASGVAVGASLGS